MRLSKGKKAGIVIALTVVLLVVDQVTKILVKTTLRTRAWLSECPLAVISANIF